MQVSALVHYPVKSLRGVPVSSLELGPHGPLYDREWMLVDEHDRFLTQRTEPRLATFTAEVVDDSVRLVDAQGASIRVQPATRIRQVTIWKDTLDALDCGDDVAQWFEVRLGRVVRLVRLGTLTGRTLDPTWVPHSPFTSAFTDAYPALITSTASLDALNAQLSQPLPMDRFRPNIVITGAPAWAEDGWRSLEVGEVTFDLVKPCARCVVITTDQHTGERPHGSAPLTVLSQHRTLPGLGAIFGQNAVHRALGVVRVGDPVRVCETQAPVFSARPE